MDGPWWRLPLCLMFAGDRTERDVPVDGGGRGKTVGEVRADERLRQERRNVVHKLQQVSNTIPCMLPSLLGSS